ncbi:transposase [Inediibacterium massiliense]|uniref:transposase n=1 Tax=Inediibacterium massiliense TaxID=1658111 RepID=UPI0006B5B133|nr:transposase [Inediibacterium massiliense]
MPRCARIKSNDSIYHIMVRSISEIKLFKKNDDKDRYLSLIQKYRYKYGFKVYAYCLMDNHGHFIIDANGADISKIMHGINFCYAQYFNQKYKRHGHVFQDRFKSKIINSDQYLISLSAYIHNNPMDIKKYQDKPQKYKYSTLGVFLGLKKDLYDIVDEKYIMSLFKVDINKAREMYLEFVVGYDNESITIEGEFINEKTEYRSERVIHARDYTPKDIVRYIVGYTKINMKKVYIKYNREATESRALCVLFMKRFCNFSHKDICRVIGNITSSRVSMLCSMGVDIILKSSRYNHIIDDFICSEVI